MIKKKTSDRLERSRRTKSRNEASNYACYTCDRLRIFANVVACMAVFSLSFTQNRKMESCKGVGWWWIHMYTLATHLGQASHAKNCWKETNVVREGRICVPPVCCQLSCWIDFEGQPLSFHPTMPLIFHLRNKAWMFTLVWPDRFSTFLPYLLPP